MLANTWTLATIPAHRTVNTSTVNTSTVNTSTRERLVELRLRNGHSHRVANRPNRSEPRAAERRPAPLALLSEPRAAARKRLVTAPTT